MLMTEEYWDYTHPPRLFSFPNLLTAKSADLEADLAWVGFTKARWTRFINRYVDKEELTRWLDRCQAAHGPTSLMFRTKVKTGPREHTGGECLIALSYRPDPSVLTLHSREGEFPQRALLDTVFAHLVIQAIGAKNTRVVWQLGGLYTSLLHSIPFIESQGLMDQLIGGSGKTSKYLGYVVNHLKKDRDNLKYGPAKRILKRWEQIQAGELAPVPLKDLTLQLDRK